MGGTYNRETGQIEWDMHVPLEAQLAHYRAHPPSALAGLTAKPVEVDFTFDGHGEPVNAVFELTCPCGSALFDVWAFIYDDDDAWRPPIEIECAGCDAAHMIFDPSDHGYDAAMRGRPLEDPEDDRGPEMLRPRDFGAPHQVLVRFEYPSDHLGGDADYKGREHDLFSYITVLAREPDTGKLAFLFDEECA